MSRGLVIVKRNSFVFNEKEYYFNDLENISKVLKTNIKIILLEEELYSKHFNEKIKKNKLKKFIEEKINNEFPESRDILYNYEQSKDHSITAIYSLRGGKRINEISKKVKNLEVKPIQYIIQECIERILGNKITNSKILVKFNNYYYYISFQKGLFYYGFAENKSDIIINRMLECEKNGEIYIDSNIEENSMLKANFQLITINIGDLLNDQVYTKQKLHSKAIL